MRFPSLLAALACLFAVPALACPPEAVQGGYCADNLQVRYVAPRQLRVLEKVVQPVYVPVQRERVVLRQEAYVPPLVRQDVVVERIETPYVVQRESVQSQSYGASASVRSESYGGSRQLNLGSRQRLNLGASGSQRTVTKSKSVTTTGRGGVLGRLLGR